jgi:hypothetical protein
MGRAHDGLFPDDPLSWQVALDFVQERVPHAFYPPPVRLEDAAYLSSQEKRYVALPHPVQAILQERGVAFGYARSVDGKPLDILANPSDGKRAYRIGLFHHDALAALLGFFRIPIVDHLTRFQPDPRMASVTYRQIRAAIREVLKGRPELKKASFMGRGHYRPRGSLLSNFSGVQVNAFWELPHHYTRAHDEPFFPYDALEAVMMKLGVRPDQYIRKKYDPPRV